MSNIRNLQSSDLENLAKKAQEDWIDTYSGFVPEQDIRELVQSAYDKEHLTQAIAAVEGGEMGFWIYEEEDGPEGWLQVADFGEGMEIGRSLLAPDHVAEALIEHARGWLKARGAKKWFSYVDGDDNAGLIVLKRNGFQETGIDKVSGDFRLEMKL